jgi:Na+/proline symporter
MSLPPVPSFLAFAATSPKAAVSGGFGWIDWAVVAVVLAGTTVLGSVLAGRHQSYRDFFLGGRALPWWAVSLSIVSAQLSGNTFISMPFIVYAGDFTFFAMPLIGALLGRFVVAFWLLPEFYRREIFSPYDYMAERLGPSARHTVSGLFLLGCVLVESGRLFATALLFQVLLAGPLAGVEAATGVRPIIAAI